MNPASLGSPRTSARAVMAEPAVYAPGIGALADEGSTILLGYHGSPAARRAIDVLATLVPAAHVVVACVVEDVFIQAASHLLIGDRPDQWRLHTDAAWASSVAEEGATHASRRGLDATPIWLDVRMSRAEALARLAEERAVALIVVGRRIDRAFLGRLRRDVAAELVRISAKPVMIVGRDGSVA